MIFLPHFIVNKKQQEQHGSWIDKIASLRPEHNRWLIGAIVILTVVFFYFANRVSFEPDMTRMNYMNASLKDAEAKLNKITAYSLNQLSRYGRKNIE
ncbi:MAG: hypothetical protein WDO19_07160 [Bacteroidota bacterium]